jgi:class I fructose-bisphosphate aldolase
MKTTPIVQDILSNYESDNTETLANLSRILMHGALGGTGKLLILPVDQGFEHGPDKSFSTNPDAYDPHYHYRLAIDAQLSAYAAPLGMLECGAKTFAGKVPTILKINSSNSLLPKSSEPDQAITASVDDAVRLGCAAVGMTIYPGSGKSLEMFEEARAIIKEAKAKGLVTVVWSYPRGGDLIKKDETSLETISYGAHIAALLGAHIIKVKIPIGNDVKPGPLNSRH